MRVNFGSATTYMHMCMYNMYMLMSIMYIYNTIYNNMYINMYNMYYNMYT